jgi:hypothetical protein
MMLQYDCLFLGGLKRQLKGPLPIPSFDAYVLSAKFITNLASKTRLSRVVKQTQFGMEFGNLLEFGDIHFSPYPSKETESLIQYFNTTTTQFRKLKIFLHSSEDVAVKYILNNLNRRTFALVALREISVDTINYVIRQNYTTLPNTNQVLSSLDRGLNNKYEMYLLSGFLTMENTIDSWALEYSIRQKDPTATCKTPQVITTPFPTYEVYINGCIYIFDYLYQISIFV